jgi:hypothetical protein
LQPRKQQKSVSIRPKCKCESATTTWNGKSFPRLGRPIIR